MTDHSERQADGLPPGTRQPWDVVVPDGVVNLDAELRRRILLGLQNGIYVEVLDNYVRHRELLAYNQGFEQGKARAPERRPEADALTIYREALERIASWGEGAEVGGHFDEPESAKIARAALRGGATP